ncbi:MAG: site-2 protease family protein [Chlorobiaceae bacterium]|nr:site-2 protease family protein [Chlorobiaceae bacterium]
MRSNHPSGNIRTPGSRQHYPLHALLFLATLFCTTWAGTFWIGRPAGTGGGIAAFFRELREGLPFSLSLLAFLSVHEFGHYFATLAHGIRATLPYYIPLPPLPFMLNIGTMGAVIKVREPFPDAESLLDTGASGPIAGFTVALGLLIYGFLHLPPEGYILSIHPGYLSTGGIPAPEPGTLFLGRNLLYLLLETLIAPKALPPMTEMYHYPYLFAGWLGCLVTSLNLLPVGQLDGGHVVYALFGRRGHERTARVFLAFITALGLPGFSAGIAALIDPEVAASIPTQLLQWSWPGWMLWAFIIARLLGTKHPSIMHPLKLSKPRRIAGWLCIAIFVLTFTPVPFGII